MNQPPRQARRARGASAALFFANGALFANVVPRFPDVKDGLALSNTAFGTAIAGYGLGALVVGLAAGFLVSRWGSARIAPLSTVGISVNLVLLALAPSWLTLAAVLLAAGSLDAVADVANNAHALRVEARYSRSILNSLHAVWSIGAVVGGVMGAAAAGLGVPLLWHLSFAAGLFAAVAVVASRFVLPGRDDAANQPGAHGSTGRHGAGRFAIVRSVVALGLIAAMAQVMEDTGATWSAVYLREDLGAVAAIGGLGFIALQATQTFGRLMGDRLVTRYGDRAVARAGAALAGVAMAVALTVPGSATTIVAFGAVGLGIGTLIPASLRTVNDLAGLPRGVGLTLVGTIERIAILVAPPLIGVTADAFGLRVGLLAIPLAATVAVVLSRALPTSSTRRP
ncbi:MAG: MFS transporter [Chloroflexota bacterium]